MTKREKFVVWLFSGVANDIISDRQAKKLYVEKYGPVGHQEFLAMLYRERRN